jgi:hypothetical protein
MNYSLVLSYDGREVYHSRDSGLRPLMACIRACRGKYQHCTLYDKVIGLAAARLIVYSGMVDSVRTPLASESAVKHLETKSITLTAEKVVSRILNKDGSDQCPMERLAQDMTDEEFYREMDQRISSSNERPRRSESSCVTP